MQPHKAFSSVNNNAVLVRLVNGKGMQFNCTPDQYMKGLKKYQQGALMQDAFPFLNADEREFLISGLLPSEFNALFSEE